MVRSRFFRDAIVDPAKCADFHTGVVTDGFSDESSVFFRAVVVGLRRQWADYCALVLFADDLSHGIVERKAEDFDMKVDGVSGEVTLGPSPVGFFYDETLVGRQGEVVGFVLMAEVPS